MDLFQDVKDFHAKFGLAYTGKPRLLPEELSEFRIKFLEEELEEYIEAVTFIGDDIPNNLEKALDSLVDLVYVVLGAAHLHGFDFNEAWRRVQAANMKKVRALQPDDSKRGSTYDVVKPQGWVPPTHRDLVEDYDK
jgi:predicted HAD superfamily Cof-like phosphohydrolase